MHSHTFQEAYSWNFTGTSMHSQRQVVEGLTILRYPWGLRNKGLITQKTCIHTFFKLQSWNFTGTSMTLRDRSWMGWRFCVTPGAQEWRVNHAKILNWTCIRIVFKIQRWKFAGTSVTPRDRSLTGYRFYGTPGSSEMKGLSLEKRKLNMHLHSFQDTELTLHRYVNDSPGQVVDGVGDFMVPRGSGIKGKGTFR